MDIFRVHRMLDDPTIFNRGGKGRAINSSNIGYTTVNRGGRAAFLITPAPQVQVFFLPSLLFILTIPQCQRISVIYYNSPANSPVNCIGPRNYIPLKICPPALHPVDLFNIKQNLKWISTTVSTPALFTPLEQLPQNCAYLRANSAAYSNSSLCPWWGWIWKRRRGGGERELIVINSLGTSILCAANDKLGNVRVISRIWTTWTDQTNETNLVEQHLFHFELLASFLLSPSVFLIS